MLFARFPDCDRKRGPVTTAWRVLGLRMDEGPAIYRVSADMPNKKRTARKRGGPPVRRLRNVLKIAHIRNIREHFNCLPGLSTFAQLGSKP